MPAAYKNSTLLFVNILNEILEKMLTMTDIKYIKDLFEKKGLSLKEITKITGYNFGIVWKYIDKDVNNLLN